MGNVEDDLTLGFQLADDIEQNVNLIVAQAGGGLVKGDNVRIAVDGLHDLDHLLVRDAQRADLGIGADVQPEPLGNGRRALVHLVEIDHAVFLAGPVTQKDVFCDRHIQQYLTFLIDNAHAVGDRVFRGRKVNRLVIDQILTKVRLIVPIQDFQQGGLTGAVLTKECVDLPAGCLKTDIVQGFYSGKVFADMPELNGIAHASTASFTPFVYPCVVPLQCVYVNTLAVL